MIIKHTEPINDPPDLMLPLTRDRFGEMMVFAVRYALGRMTYAAKDTAEAVEMSWSTLRPQERQVIRDSIKQALVDAERAGETLGHQCDHDVWTKLLAWIDA